MRSEFRQQVNVGSRHAAVRDVADDRDLQTVEPAFALTNRQRVEQGLRRMLVSAVAAVDDARLGHARDRVRRARRAWRITTQSAAIASSVLAVSISVSPLETLLVEQSTC